MDVGRSLSEVEVDTIRASVLPSFNCITELKGPEISFGLTVVCVNENVNKEILGTPPDPPHSLKKKNEEKKGKAKYLCCPIFCVFSVCMDCTPLYL